MTQEDTDVQDVELEPVNPEGLDEEAETAEVEDIEHAEELQKRLDQAIEAQSADDSKAACLQFVSDYFAETGAEEDDVLAALVSLAHAAIAKKGGRKERGERQKRGRDRFEGQKTDPLELATEEGMERYRIEVGYSHGVKPGSIVGAIANEADISSEYIGRIEIYDDFSTVDLPEGMPDEVSELLQDTRVRGQKLLITKVGAS